MKQLKINFLCKDHLKHTKIYQQIKTEKTIKKKETVTKQKRFFHRTKISNQTNETNTFYIMELFSGKKSSVSFNSNKAPRKNSNMLSTDSTLGFH